MPHKGIHQGYTKHAVLVPVIVNKLIPDTISLAGIFCDVLVYMLSLLVADMPSSGSSDLGPLPASWNFSRSMSSHAAGWGTFGYQSSRS